MVRVSSRARMQSFFLCMAAHAYGRWSELRAAERRCWSFCDEVTRRGGSASETSPTLSSRVCEPNLGGDGGRRVRGHSLVFAPVCVCLHSFVECFFLVFFAYVCMLARADERGRRGSVGAQSELQTDTTRVGLPQYRSYLTPPCARSCMLGVSGESLQPHRLHADADALAS